LDINAVDINDPCPLFHKYTLFGVCPTVSFVLQKTGQIYAKPLKKQASQSQKQLLTARMSGGSNTRHLGETGQNMERVKEVMTLREASQYLGISPDTLYKYLGEDKIPAFKLGNRWRFKKDLLDRWMDKKSERVAEKTEHVVDSKPKRFAKTTVKG
jgi:excisionase family DNA binding protein